jgi:hypothetical protein
MIKNEVQIWKLLLILNVKFCSVPMTLHGDDGPLFKMQLPGNSVPGITSFEHNYKIFSNNPIFPNLFNALQIPFSYPEEQRRSVVENHYAANDPMFKFLVDNLPIGHRIVYDIENTYFIVIHGVKGNPKIRAFVTPKLFVWHWEQKTCDTNSGELIRDATIYQFETCYGKRNIWRKESLMTESFWITFTVYAPKDDKPNFIVCISNNQKALEISLNINGILSLEVLEILFSELYNTLKYEEQYVDENRIAAIIEKHVIDNGFQIMCKDRWMRAVGVCELQNQHLITALSRELFMEAMKRQDEQCMEHTPNTTQSIPWYIKLVRCFRSYL